MSDEKPEAPVDDNNGEEKINRKTIIYIVLTILMVLAILASIILPGIIRDKDSPSGEGDVSFTPTTTAPENPDGNALPGDNLSDKEKENMYGNGGVGLPEGTGDPGPATLREFTPTYLPKKEPLTSPVAPTGAPLSEDEKHGHEHYAPYDPKKMDPQQLSKIHIQDMFSFDISDDGGWKNSMEDIINKYGTERAKQVGFRPTRLGDPNQHVPEWEMMKLRGNMKVVSAVQPTGSERISDTVIRYDYTMMPRLVGKNETTRLHDVNSSLYMKHENGGWYIDAYEVDYNTPMDIY